MGKVCCNCNNFVINDKEKEFEKLFLGCENILPKEDFKKRLLSKKSLIVKLGVDPTSPNIHLGHTIVLEKLKDFQDLGHTVIFLIGNFTAKIGDPSGKSKLRPPLSDEEIAHNIKTYKEQIGRILDLEKVKVVYNADWFSSFTLSDFIKLAGRVTLSQILQREDFSKRLVSNTPIGMHEIFYPVLQAYDSVILKADIEIGGTDQTFNMLMGRQLQSLLGLEEQTVITMPIIEGLGGVKKMSKSLKNDISLLDDSNSAFLKIMSINDELMKKYYRLVLRYSDLEISDLIKKTGHMEAKKQLARSILQKYWSLAEANSAYLYFSEVIQKKNYDHSNMIKKVFFDKGKEYKIIDMISFIDQSLSRSEIRRLLGSGAVCLQDKRIFDEKFFVSIQNGDNKYLKIGKKKIFIILFNK